ncbi:hypothetical protein AAY473_032629 [Plecturocebus cupreus]
MGCTLSRTLSPDCRIISTISSLDLLSTLCPLISTSRSPGTSPRARSLVPAPGSAKWTTRRYAWPSRPRSSMVVRRREKPKSPVGRRSSSSSRRAGGGRGTTGGRRRSAGNFLVTSSGARDRCPGRGMPGPGCCTSCPSRVLTSTCGEGAAECSEGVEVSEALSSRLRWEKEKRLTIICEFCLASEPNLAARCSTEPRKLPSSPLRSSLELAVLRWPESRMTLPRLLSESMLNMVGVLFVGVAPPVDYESLAQGLGAPLCCYKQKHREKDQHLNIAPGRKLWLPERKNPAPEYVQRWRQPTHPPAHLTGDRTEESLHFERLKRVDHLRPGVRDQPGQHGRTLSLLKIQKLARSL